MCDRCHLILRQLTGQGSRQTRTWLMVVQRTRGHEGLEASFLLQRSQGCVSISITNTSTSQWLSTMQVYFL